MTTAVVTGSTRGIGRAIAAAILAQDGRVMLTGRDQSSVDRVVEEMSSDAPGRVAGHVVDVQDPAGAERLMAVAAERFGGFDALVNNAGVGRFANVGDMTIDDWDSVIGTNLSGAFYCSHAAVPRLKQRGGGWIINISSLAGANPFATGAAYCASKAGLIAFSEALMQEVRFDNIRVSVIMPGSVATEFSRTSKDDDVSWKLTADDVARVVVDLLNHPSRSLPSKVELRPAKTKPKK
jgi:NADP-dependent 3-hydroxy acid dehydrogenase YdfG